MIACFIAVVPAAIASSVAGLSTTPSGLPCSFCETINLSTRFLACSLDGFGVCSHKFRRQGEVNRPGYVSRLCSGVLAPDVKRDLKTGGYNGLKHLCSMVAVLALGDKKARMRMPY